MPGMDDFYMAHARQHQRQRQGEAERARLARVAKRAARQRAGARPMPPDRDGGRAPRLSRRVAAVPGRVAALRRAAGYALLEAGVRLLTPPSRRSRAGAAGVAESMPVRGSDSP